MQFKSDVEAVDAFVEKFQKLKTEVAKVIIGQDEIVKSLIISVFSKGHCLLVGVPGLAKTLMVNSLAKALGLKYNRIQFTPDLMPSDIIGTEILDETRKFKFIQGPLFTNILLADEINRTPPKTQSALLEAMQERAVTTAGVTFKLDYPFFVLATQNPIEQEGTYPLPEAQVDRFMLKVLISYPNKEEEKAIIRENIGQTFPSNNTILKPEDILKARNIVREVYMDEKIENYITDIVFATRFPSDYKLDKIKPLINFGASPRASINLALAAKAYAFIKRRGYIIPEDIRAVSHDVLRHRIGLTYEAAAENITTEEIINEILNTVEVP